LGRFLSIDPLSKSYPYLSSYQFANNSPICNIDVDGKYFTGNTATLKAIYARVSIMAKNGDKKAEAFKIALEKMDASDIEFHIKVNQKQFNGEGKHGEASFDFKENRVFLEVNQYYREEGPQSTEASLAHELEHGRQFMDSELDFIEGMKSSSFPGPSYDKTDEYNALDIQNMINDNEPFRSDVTEEQKKAQKAQYSNRLDGPINTTEEKTKVEEGAGGRKSYKSNYNYSPNEKQKAEKKSVLDEK
jgi:hypothetical protein